jgi:hypothetical protein
MRLRLGLFTLLVLIIAIATGCQSSALIGGQSNHSPCPCQDPDFSGVPYDLRRIFQYYDSLTEMNGQPFTPEMKAELKQKITDNWFDDRRDMMGKQQVNVRLKAIEVHYADTNTCPEYIRVQLYSKAYGDSEDFGSRVDIYQDDVDYVYWFDMGNNLIKAYTQPMNQWEIDMLARFEQNKAGGE